MHSSCNDGVIQLSPLSFYAMLEVVERPVMRVLYTFSCSIPNTLQSTRFKFGNLEATVKTE